MANTELQQAKQAGLSASDRFTSRVLAEVTDNAGKIHISAYQRRLIQGYFIGIDQVLKAAEEERLRKNASNKDHKWDNDLPVTWANVNLGPLAIEAVHCARIGLDMMQKNHLYAIPYKNNKAQKYDVELAQGYNGIQYTAEKYAFDPFKSVTVELVYDSDTFTPIKRSAANKVESYEFAINQPFDRGEVIGGFGYIEYEDPTKNRLIMMSRQEIEKRRPDYASANFWGGRQKKWINGKQEEVEVPGWYEEMCLKTIKREVYSDKNIPRDPKRVDDDYQHMMEQALRRARMEAQAEIDENANRVIIDTIVQENEPDQNATDTLPELQAPAEEVLPAPKEQPGF